MSDERFYLGNNGTTICDRNQGGSDGFNMLTIFKVVDLLNEMSETIVEQQSFIGRELLKFDKYLAERLIEKEEIIKEQETIINQLDQKIKDKNEYQRVLEAKIRRLKDRIKVLEK